MLRVTALGLAAAVVLSAAYQPAGDVVGTRQVDGGAELSLNSGFSVRIEWIDRDIVRFDTRKTGEGRRTVRIVSREPSRDIPIEYFDSHDLFVLSTPGATLSVTKRPFRWFITRPDGTIVAAQHSPGLSVDPVTGAVLARLIAFPQDAFYGGGLDAADPNRRGRRFWLRNTALAGFDESTAPLHINVPFLWAIGNGRALGYFLDDSGGALIDVDTASDGSLLLAGGSGGLDYYVFLGPNPAQVANAYARLTGFQPLPPRWALGYHQSRFGYASADEILSIARQFREQSIPLDSIHLDLDYMNRLQALTWDPTTFRDPPGMHAALAELRVRTVNIVEPCLLTADPLYAQLAYNQMLLLGPDRLPFNSDIFLGRVGWIDFGYPAARDWYKERLATFLRTGVDGIWNDLNEPADNFIPETVLHRIDGQQYSHVAVRNAYAVQQASLSYEAMRQAFPNRRPFVLSRAGSPGIQKYAANWSGDTHTSFESLRANVKMTVNMGLSGQNLFGHDVGGFLGSPSPELLIRWMQFAAFTPFFRTHSNRDTAAREPWAYGYPYIGIVRDAIREHYRILPYLYTLFERTSRTGEPVVAPTAYHFPADAATARQSYEYMLGPHVLVAPVVEEGVTERPVYLPAGTDWADYYTGQIHRGGEAVKARADIERIPLFVRAGSMLPKADGEARNADDAATRPLTLDIYPGAATSEFEMYEDDGLTFEYQAGQGERTRWTRSTTSEGHTVIGAARTGRVTGAKTWTLRLLAHGAPPERVVSADGEMPRLRTEEEFKSAARGWYLDIGRSVLFVRFNLAGSATVRIEPSR